MITKMLYHKISVKINLQFVNFKIFLSNLFQKPDYLLNTQTLSRRARKGDPDAMFLLGLGYADGRFGFPKDFVEAKKWIELSKDKWPHVAAKCAYGFSYEGQNIPDETALNFYSTPFERKYIPGMFLYINVLFKKESHEIIFPPIIKEGLFLLMEECYHKGFVPAATSLGIFYFVGWGTEKNVDKAFKLLHEAAEKKDGVARLLLAEAYYTGIPGGIGINKVEALKWLRLAAQQGFEKAYYLLKDIDRNLGQVLPWRPRAKCDFFKAMIRIGCRDYGEEPPWTLVETADNMLELRNKEGNIALLFLLFNDGTAKITFKEDSLSETTLFIVFLIFGHELTIDFYSFDDAKLYLEKTIKINEKFAEQNKTYRIKLSQKTIEEFLKNEEFLNSYPIVKKAINQQLVETHSN